MAFSTQRAVSDGSMTYLDLSIEYIKRADILVFMNDVPAEEGSWAWVGTTDKRISFTPAVPNGVEVLIKRTTQIDKIINVYARGAKFNNDSMDTNFRQVMYLNQEAVEGAALTDIFNDVDFHGYRIRNLGEAQNPNEAITLGQVQEMSTGPYIAKQEAELARDKAKEWATKATEVEPGLASAKTYAAQATSGAVSAQASAVASAGSASSSSSSATSANASSLQAARWASLTGAPVEGGLYSAKHEAAQAAASAQLSEDWASAPLDVVVADGEYSAKHYSIKAAQYAADVGEVPQAVHTLTLAIRAMFSASIGVPIPWPNATVPAGYLPMDGSAFDMVANPILAQRYPSGLLPDLRRRFIRGSGTGFAPLTTQSNANASHTHTVTVAEGGSHGHTATSSTTGAHTHTTSGTAASSGGHTHLAMSNTGASGSGPTASNRASTLSETGGLFVRSANGAANVGLTSSAGAHTHTTSGTAASNGNHTHTITVNNGGSHTHTGTASASGDTESRPDNTAFQYICMTDAAIPELPTIGG